MKALIINEKTQTINESTVIINEKTQTTMKAP